MKGKGDEYTPLREQVEASGFPFQLAVQRTIEGNASSHGWVTLGSEVPCGERYVDLVLRRGALVIAIECKRTTATTWVFLTETGDQPANRLRIPWWNDRAPEVPGLLHASRILHDEFYASPLSPEAQYCVVFPKDRLAFDPAARDVAADARNVGSLQIKRTYGPEFYIPVIVTNARLVTCEIEASSTSLDTGKIGELAWTDHDFVRYRKTLAQGSSNDYPHDDPSWQSWQEDRARTVFVVRAPALAGFLKDFGHDFVYHRMSPMPPSWNNPETLLPRNKP